MAKSKQPSREEALELYQQLIAEHPEVELKGAKNPYTSCNGHMFSFLSTENAVALRLAKVERDAFLEKYATKLCEQHGTVMKEYVEVPWDLLQKTSELQPYLVMSYDYVSALKPKPTTRKKKK